MPHQHKFVTLDAMRGIAAILVVTRHTSSYWMGLNFYHSYLAVDLFFMLSGFVISHAYDKRLVNKTMSAFAFIITRVIRLYPLYLLAAIISALVFFPKKALIHGEINQVVDYLISIILSLFYLPSKSFLTPSLYPINGVSWSLFYELIINLLYVTFRPMLTPKNLIVIIVLSGLNLAFIAITMNSIDMGSTWELFSINTGFTRTVFGFSVGLYLHRVFVVQAAREVSTNKSIFLALIATSALVMVDAGKWNGLIDCCCLILVFPFALLLGAKINPHNGWVMNIFINLGIISYPVYLFHDSFGSGLLQAFRLLGLNVSEYAPYSGLLLILMLCLFSLLLNNFYDRPLRSYFSYLAFHKKHY